MFCCYCGKNIPDDAKFCGYCGKATPAKEAPVKEEPASVQEAPTNTGFVGAAPECKNPPKPEPVKKPASSGYRLTQYGGNTYAAFSHKAAQVQMTYKDVFSSFWRRLVSSPMVIITVVLYWIMTIVSISTSQDSLDELYIFLDALQMEELASMMLSFQIISFLPSMLIGIGMILIVVDGFRTRTKSVSSVGLHIIRTTMIVQVSMIFAVMALVLFGMLALSSRANSASIGGYRSSSLDEITGALIIAFMMAIGFMIFYVCCLFTVMNNALHGVRNGSTDNSKVMVLAVFQFIAASFVLLAMLAEEMYDFGTVLSFASTLCLGIVLVQYNTMLNNTYYAQLNAENEY